MRSPTGGLLMSNLCQFQSITSDNFCAIQSVPRTRWNECTSLVCARACGWGVRGCTCDGDQKSVNVRCPSGFCSLCFGDNLPSPGLPEMFVFPVLRWWEWPSEHGFCRGFWGIELRSSCLWGNHFYLLSILTNGLFLQWILTGSSFLFQIRVGVGNRNSGGFRSEQQGSCSHALVARNDAPWGQSLLCLLGNLGFSATSRIVLKKLN